MGKYKLIASDLDGTLMNGRMKISDENWAAIVKLKELGVHFVPTSGRAFGELTDEIRESPLFRYYITSDGSVVYDKETDKTYTLRMPHELGHVALDKIFSYPSVTMLHACNECYVDEEYTESDYRRCGCDDRWVDFIYDKDIPVPDFKKFCYDTDEIEITCSFFENNSDLLECKAFFDSHPDFLTAQSDKYNLEVFWSKAGKGNAVQLLADILGIDISETIAVGDSTNDYTMIKDAGLGLAMQNACEELKCAADAVICNNEQHSAQYILNKYISA